MQKNAGVLNPTQLDIIFYLLETIDIEKRKKLKEQSLCQLFVLI